MVAWWYANKDKKSGPVPIDELKLLYQAGKIDAQTMLWHEGMETWQTLDQVEELDHLRTVVPPPLPAKKVSDKATYIFAARWPRFFARIFDVWWEVLLVALILGGVLGYYSASYVEWINKSSSSQLFSILCLPIALCLDAIVYSIFSNTPGKALLGINVETANGKPLSFLQYLSRNLSMWARGFAFGIPFINLFTMATQSSRLGNGQQASYDEATGFRVRSRPSSWVRTGVFSIAFLVLVTVMLILNSMEQTSQRNATLHSTLPNYSWENPITKLNGKIDSRWKNSAQKNDAGQQIYLFSEQTDHAVVIFGMQQESSYTLDDYVRTFQKSTTANMRFSDGGRFFEINAHQGWEGSGNMVDVSNTKLRVQIIQSGSTFWRIVTVQSMPYGYSDALAEQLQTALWNTVK
jgi:uncharacterized RDD family membrane protein YckC